MQKHVNTFTATSAEPGLVATVTSYSRWKTNL